MTRKPARLRPSLCVALAAAWLSGCAHSVVATAPATQKEIETTVRSASIDLSFDPQTGALTDDAMDRLGQFRATVLRPGDPDRVVVARTSTMERGAVPVVNAMRTVRQVLAPQAVVQAPASATVTRGRLNLTATWTDATVPSCPDWSRPLAASIGLTTPNWGCASATNLAAMVARPADLSAPLPEGSADGTREAAAVERYRAGKVAPLLDWGFAP